MGHVFGVVIHGQAAGAAFVGALGHKADKPARQRQQHRLGLGGVGQGGQLRPGAADAEQAAVELHERFELRGAGPVQPVDGQRTAVGIGVAVFGAGELLPRLQKRQALAGQADGRAQAVLGQKVGVGRSKVPPAGHAFELVPQREVVVGGDILHDLPGRFGVHAVGAVAESAHRMQQRVGRARRAVDKAGGFGVEHAALDRIARVVAENADAVVQQRQRAFIGRARAGVHAGAAALPRLAVHEDLAPAGQRVQRGADGVHRLDIVQGHKVEAEAVDVVGRGPIDDRIHHVFAHHRALAGQVAAAAGAVGQAAVRPAAQPVAGHGAFHPVIGIIGMVVDDVHHDAEPGAVQRRDHCPAFAHADFAVPGVGGIGTFRHIVVERVVAPVVAAGAGLVDGGEVKDRLQLHMADAETFQIVQAGRVLARKVKRGAVLREGEELAAPFRPHAAVFIGREIGDMDLPHAGGAGVPRRGGAAVGGPVFRRGGVQVQHHAALAVGPGRAGGRVDQHRGMAVRKGQFINIILPGQIAADGRAPDAAFGQLHRRKAKVGRAGFGVGAGGVPVHRRRGRRGRPQRKRRVAFGVYRAQVLPAVDRQGRSLFRCHDVSP